MINSSCLMLLFSIMVLLMAQSISSAIVVALVITESRMIITSLSVYGYGFGMMVSMASFFCLCSTI
jgi:hypothetical protein